jgi:hypothetical protein
MTTRKASSSGANPSPSKKQRIAVQPEEDDPSPAITAKYHQKRTIPALHQISDGRKIILADLKTLLEEVCDDIGERTTDMKNAPVDKEPGFRKSIASLERYKGVIAAAMGFVHIMEESVIEIELLWRKLKPAHFATRFVDAYGAKGVTILNYCKSSHASTLLHIFIT